VSVWCLTWGVVVFLSGFVFEGGEPAARILALISRDHLLWGAISIVIALANFGSFFFRKLTLSPMLASIFWILIGSTYIASAPGLPDGYLDLIIGFTALWVYAHSDS